MPDASPMRSSPATPGDLIDETGQGRAGRREPLHRLQAANPDPTTELEYRTPFELLVAVVLSAQATDKSVNQATAELFVSFNTPEKIAGLGVAGLEKYIRRIGLFRTKARNVVALS